MPLTRKQIAKTIAWIAGSAGVLAASGSFGKYSHLALELTPIVAAWATHLASDTSAGHPNGANQA